MPSYNVFHEVDPKFALMEKVGSIDGLQLWNNHVLVAVYVRPDVTKGGIVLPGSQKKEDVYQSKIGLVIGKGESACQETSDGWFKGVECNVGDWVLFRPSDGLHMQWKNNVDVRLFKDTLIIGKVSDPDLIY